MRHLALPVILFRRLAEDGAGGIGVIAALPLPIVLGGSGQPSTPTAGLMMPFAVRPTASVVVPTARNSVRANGMTDATVIIVVRR